MIDREQKLERMRARSRRIRLELQDPAVPRQGLEKTKRVDLGLTLLSFYAVPGISYTREEIAAWCGCTTMAIYQIELRALKKMRTALMFKKQGEMWRELALEFFASRRAAEAKERIAAW